MAVLAAGLVFAVACSSEQTGPSTSGFGNTVSPDDPRISVLTIPLKEVGLERVFSWYGPERPTHMEETPDGTGRIFVSEQAGLLIEVIGGPENETGSTRVALDITEKVSTRIREEGFLGFAFHPDFSLNGRLLVYYSADRPRRSVLSEFTFGPGGVIDPDSERMVMEIQQPFGNHNGGMLLFGPDGFLYVALGDGGGAGDEFGNGQNLSTLLGSILRIDVDAPGVPYAVPVDNPFTGKTAANGGPARGEIWAYGLRNPWRLAFDDKTGEFWAADVGQNAIEEVNLIVKGGNYGWNIREGQDCYEPEFGCEDIAPPDLIGPVESYSHRFGCSITGGYVYRGQRVPSLRGAYIYGDFCSGSIWALRRHEEIRDEQAEVVSSDHSIPAFGQTLDGEVYLLTYSPGIFRFVER